MLLEGKVVMVSGVGPGLGRALVLEAVAEGAAVVCVARTATYLDEVAAEVVAGGGRALPIAGDITSTPDCLRIAAETERWLGRLDGLVNSAFTAGAIAPFEEVELEDWRRTFEVNVFGTLSMIRANLPLLRRHDGAAVVNVNTMSAMRPMKNQGGYGGSKAALEFLTRQLAVELGPSGVRLNTVYCGPMIGPNLNSAMEAWAERRGEPLDGIKETVASHMALCSIPEDDEAARAIVMMLSDKASIVTGAALHATGGAWLEQRI
jgi:NAD(P)-dependent dehydrogenase (short-subunit alcohol dehydrogenase family)